MERENALLRAALDAAAAREQAAQEERGLLLQMLHEAQQRYDRLLEAPRATPVAPSTVPGPAPQDDRGAMRRRILALLREHPEGLTPAQVRERLATGKPMGNTLFAMARDGLVQRLGGGRYGVA